MASLIFYLEDGTTLNHTLDEGTTTLGRHPDSVVVLEFPSVSGHHATIEFGESGCFVTDLKSSNGTRVNGVEIEEAQLNDGDRISFGDVQAVFAADDTGPAALAPANSTLMPPPSRPAPPAMPVQPALSAAPAARPSPAPAPKRAAQRPTSYREESGSGCGTAIVVTLLFIAAMLTGLYMRHHQETNGGNFFKDVMDKMGTKVPKIEIEVKE